MRKNNHVLIIRFHYEQNDPRFEWRFKYFKDRVLPCILRQTVSDFDIAIRCNPWHEELFKELSPRIITFQVHNERASYKKDGKFRYFYDFTAWENVIGLEKYMIQSGLDSDDLIADNYIQAIRETIHKYKGRNNRSLHICFQPEIFNVKTRKISPIGVIYKPTIGSAFMTLYQPDYWDETKEYHFVYEQSHLTLGRLAFRSIVLPKGFCVASVHAHNESTGKIL